MNASLRILTLLFLHGTFNLAAAQSVDHCPGYNATNISNVNNGFNADLVLAGTACNVYGPDLQKLSLSVVYETGVHYLIMSLQIHLNYLIDNRIHMKITDLTGSRYEVPADVFPRPQAWNGNRSPNIRFEYTHAPFSFSIIRARNNETLFNTTGSPLVFEPQYLRLQTSLPTNANIYGLGEHTNPFRLPPDNTTVRR
jgi:alpha-glucosidase